VLLFEYIEQCIGTSKKILKFHYPIFPVSDAAVTIEAGATAEEITPTVRFCTAGWDPQSKIWIWWSVYFIHLCISKRLWELCQPCVNVTSQHEHISSSSHQAGYAAWGQL